MKIEKKYIGVENYNLNKVIPSFCVSSFVGNKLSFDSFKKNKDATFTISIRNQGDFEGYKFARENDLSCDDFKDFDSVYSVTISKEELKQIISFLKN